MAQLSEHLSENGVILVSGFGHNHKTDSKIGEADLIQPRDFEPLKGHFDLLYYEEYEDIRGFFVTYVYRKK